MRASGQPTLPVVGLQQLNDFAESYSAANLDLEVANTRRSQLAQTRGRKVSAALARGGRRSPRHHRPAHEAHRAREEARAPFPSTYAEDGLVGKRTRPLIYPSPPATAPCWHAFGGGRVFGRRCATRPRQRRTHSPPPPPGQHARVIGRVRVIPPDARTLLDAPASGTDLRRLSIHQLQLQCTAKHATRRSPPGHPCATPRSHGPFLPRAGLGRRRVRSQRAAPCTAHHFVQDLPGTHAHRTCAAAPTRPERTRCSPRGN